MKWTDDRVYFTSQGKYHANTQRQLKEMLLKDIIDYFDKGKVNQFSKCTHTSPENEIWKKKKKGKIGKEIQDSSLR